ncbi:MAG TPA: hypothetical protein VFJ05_00895 [Nitrososphaeraceae archaeon]|nr:hypothetical protein [Nitrososphaeraceae archaeon]
MSLKSMIIMSFSNERSWGNICSNIVIITTTSGSGKERLAFTIRTVILINDAYVYIHKYIIIKCNNSSKGFKKAQEY